MKSNECWYVIYDVCLTSSHGPVPLSVRWRRLVPCTGQRQSLRTALVTRRAAVHTPDTRLTSFIIHIDKGNNDITYYVYRASYFI